MNIFSQNLSWLHRKETKTLFSFLTKTSIEARFVGGCVRNALLGKDSKDIDLAVATPYPTLLKAIESHDLKIIIQKPQYQTITIKINNTIYELTSLRSDYNYTGRHSDTTFCTDWAEDAKRRDFTINALYCDQDGNIYDYLTGLEDFQNKILRFIGDPQQRIQEDALRLLRLFRFYAQLDGFSVSQEDLKACTKNKELLNTLSAERIRKEFFLTLDSPHWKESLHLMGLSEILNKLITHPVLDHLKALENTARTFEYPLTPFLKLASLGGTTLNNQVEEMPKRFSLTRVEKKELSFFSKNISLFDEASTTNLKLFYYLYGKDLFLKTLILAFTHTQRDRIQKQQEIKSFLDQQPLAFPLKGQDLKELGIPKGPEIGEILHKCLEWWVTEQNLPRKEDCLHWVRENFL